MLGKHPLKAWSSTQSVVAMSSAEAELYSACDGACRGLGLQTMLGELGGERRIVSVFGFVGGEGVRLYTWHRQDAAFECEDPMAARGCAPRATQVV